MSTWGFKALKQRGLEIPAGEALVDVSPVGRARIRYNQTTMQLEASLNGGAYVALSTGGGASPWLQAGTVVRLQTVTDDVVIGDTVLVAGEKLRVVGDTRIEGAAFVESLSTPGGSGLDLDISSDGGSVSATVADNVASAFSVVEGVNSYLDVTTTNGGEVVTIGNATTNPPAEFAGSGDVRLLDGGALRISERLADPAAVLNNGFVYVKDVGTVSELFYEDDSGNVTQLTSGGAPVAGGADTEVQFNNAGQLDGVASLTFDGSNVTASAALFADGGIDRSAAADLAVGGTNATSVSIGNTGSTTSVELIDNTADAFTVAQGLNKYIDVDTLDGNENVVIGNTTTDPNLFFRAASDSELSIFNSDVTWEVPDNTGPAWRLFSGGGADTYIQVTTTNLSEEVALGTTSVNPTFNWRGTGDFNLSGGSAIRITDRAADPDDGAATDGTIYTKVDGSGDAQLFYKDGANNVIQLTADGSINLGSLTGTFDFDITDNTSQAFLVHEGLNDYIECTTTNGASLLRLGNTGGGGEPNVIQMSLATGQSAALQVDAGGTVYFQIDTIGGTKLVFGNAATDPSFEFVGDGPVQLGTAGGHNNFLRILDRTGDPTPAAGAGDVYTKNVTVTELFYQNDTGGVMQLTDQGRVNFDTSDALGGGAAATLGTIGGTGPTTAAQSTWVEVTLGGVVGWLALWV